MKRIKNADINFKLNPKRINLNNFSMKFYTVNSEAYFFIKDQDNVVSVEREATIYDDPEVIISGGTVAVDYYLPLDWSELVQLGEGVLNYRCINNIEDPFFPDLVYNQVVEDTTAYYIDSDIHIDPADDKNLIERVVELESNLAVETADREDADVFLSGAVDTEIARAISAETELSERIDAIESGASEALDDEIARAEAAEAALQDAIDAEEARAIAIENAIRQDLTDESELRSSADTTMWTAINNETTRATSAETAIENKVDVETLRAIGVENAISGDLQTYKATNNAALQAETTRATSAETALQTAIQNEATARANADAALGIRIDNISSASTAAIEAEEVRAREAESGLTTALQNEVTRATSAETQLSNSLTTEINRATSAETAIDNKIDTETLRAIGVENTISGNLETYKATANAALQAETTRATSAETALQTAIDNEATARANADTALQTAITNEVSRAREAESGITNSLNAEVTRATGAESALDAKANTVSGNVITETTRATTAENALSGAIDSISAATSGSVEELDAKIDTVSGNVITEEARAKGVENALSGAIDTLDVRFFDNAKYENSGNTKVINFYNAGVVKATIDATDFIKDGMISTVELVQSGTTSVLVITWNTDAGSQVTTIDVGDIFEADNYYTKSETSGATELATAFAEKLAISDFNTYSGAVDTTINSKASQSDLDTLSGTVTAHTADTTVHVTASDKTKWNKVDEKADATAVTAAIDAAVSGKANSNDVYLKTETSGATEIANALNAKQNQLVAGENIIISGNVISSEGGGCEVEETTIFDRVNQPYYDNWGEKGKITYTMIDYSGDKTTADNVQVYFEIGDTSNAYMGWIYFDYVNESANTDSSISGYVIVEYITEMEYFKVSIASAYQSTYWIKNIQNLDIYNNALIPFYTINSGSPCTVITTDVVGLVNKVKNKAFEALSDCTFQTSEDNMYLDVYRINGSSGRNTIKLEDLDGSNSTLKPNINIPLGVSGWTEMTFNGSCSTNENPKSPIIRLSGDTNSLNAFNTQWEVNLEHYGGTYDSVYWNGSEFVLNSSWFGENGQFGTASVTYDDANNTLTIAYPLTAQVGGVYTDNVVLKNIYNQNCQFGTAITKLEYYGEFVQPLKPYAQQLRTDVNTISGQVATICQTIEDNEEVTAAALNVLNEALGGLKLVKLTQQEYTNLQNKDNNTLYVIVN